MKDSLALIVLLASVSMYQSRDGLEDLVRYWLPGYCEQRLESLIRKLPQVELKTTQEGTERVVRGHAKDI